MALAVCSDRSRFPRPVRPALPAAEQRPQVGSHIWAWTAFELAHKLAEVDQTVQLQDGENGPFIALGDMVCAERYIMMKAHVVNRTFARAPLSLKPEIEYPHMTLVKLEHGSAERSANLAFWTSDIEGYSGHTVNVTAVLRRMNERLRTSGVLFRLISAHIQQDHYSNRYNITGGEALELFRRLQGELLQECECLGEGCVGRWSEAPAHPHISYDYEYPAEDHREQWWKEAEEGVTKSCASAVSTPSSGGSSMQIVLSRLDSMKLNKWRKIFIKERLTRSVIGSASDEQLKEVGIHSLGDRIKVRRLAEELSAVGGASAAAASASVAASRGDSASRRQRRRRSCKGAASGEDSASMSEG